jgi:hypothetical protein
MFFLSLSSSCRRASVPVGFEAAVLSRSHQFEGCRVFARFLNAVFVPRSFENKALGINVKISPLG